VIESSAMKSNLLLLFVAALGAGIASAQPTRAFIGARIIDGTGKPAIEHGTLIIRDGRVEAVGPSSRIKPPARAERIDLTGKTIMPGLVNAHGHLGDTQGLKAGPEFYTRENLLRQLGLYARYGVTTVFSLGGDKEQAFKLRDEQSARPLTRSRAYLAGTIIIAETPEDARKMVDTVAATKPDIIKIRVDDNLGTTKKMPEAVYRAVIEEAHTKGLRVAAHLFYLDDAKGLLKDGVDLVAHSIRDRDIDDETIALLKARDVCVVPTLTREVSAFAYAETPAFFQDPFFLREADPNILAQLKEPARQQAMRDSAAAKGYKAGLEVANRNLKKLSDAGVRLAFGTDTGPPARFQGYFEHMELEMMVKAGLTPMQALKAATGDAAVCMKVAGQVGTLERGTWADFVVLGANPLADIHNTKTLESVWIGGDRVPAK
jgi:imidazolonepropionase-like amidohydrolase